MQTRADQQNVSVPLVWTMDCRDQLGDPAIGRTVDRLCTEFETRFPREFVTRTVGGCIDDLSGTPSGAIPELSERLARQRLLDIDSARGFPAQV